ncbi:MAG: ATP-binding cassette domain-containing protein [Zavarzinia sp.]|nr:ATP-binding cassette domain-containing protein [Zavarzinia sp.]
MSEALPVVRLKSVTEYGQANENTPLFNKISLDIPPATSVGILGGPRTGKSTLARLIAGQNKPTAGSIKHAGNVSWPSHLPIRPMPTLTLRDYVHFIARIYSADPDHVLDNVLTISGLPGDGKLLMGDLDKIARTKLNFSLKFAFDFDCYIMDELSFSPDPIFKLMAETVTERMRNKRSLVILSKSERLLKRFCDVIYQLDAGNLQNLGPCSPPGHGANDPE